MNNYELKFDPKTIEHLGVKMYATLPPALAELISNAYDADASHVRVEFLEQNGSPKAITVIDDGLGMSASDIQNKFLVIGRNRRHDDGDAPSPKFNRLPTGKKGLGKLALFGLAKNVAVDTVNLGLRNRFLLDWDALKEAKGVYNPIAELTDEKVAKGNGTTIQLSELKRKSPFDLDAIADSLSRIFIVDEGFSITLADGKREISITNERRYANVEEQFKWTQDDLIDPESPYFGKIKLTLLTAKTPIPPSSGLRGVAIFSRGKLVNLPEYFSDSTSSHFYQYLTGWITADFIDLIDEDVISTNRQAINWDNADMAELRQFLSSLISKVGQEWRKKRANKKDTDLERETGIDKQKWFGTLPDEVKASVETIVNKMGDSEEVAETYSPVIKALYALVPEYPLLHWRHLHASIKGGVEEYYRNKQYGHAADQGTKLYGARLRDMSGKDVDGTDLAALFSAQYDQKTKALTRNPDIQLSDLSNDSKRNIQEGQGDLTRGLIKAFRNPINHAPVAAVVPAVISELDCLNILSLVSYLTSRLDGVAGEKKL